MASLGDMIVEDFSFPSANGRDEIAAWLYHPETGAGPPRALFQLIHGYAEHSRRYLPMIEALTREGIVVAADDHVGHGVTALSSGSWLDTGGTGYQTFIDDELTLTEIARGRYPDLPLILFGHSWGSMIAREYVSQRRDLADGLILSGVVEQLTSAGLDLEVLSQSARATIAINVSPKLREVSPRLQVNTEEEVFSELGAVLAAKATARYDEDDPMAWVATDVDARREFLADPLGAPGRQPSSDFFRDLLGLYIRVGSDRFPRRVDKNLRILILSGDQDPMGNYGEGAYHLANKLWKEGNPHVRTRVFPGARHEIQREESSRDGVREEVLRFVDDVIGAGRTVNVDGDPPRDAD